MAIKIIQFSIQLRQIYIGDAPVGEAFAEAKALPTPTIQLKIELLRAYL